MATTPWTFADGAVVSGANGTAAPIIVARQGGETVPLQIDPANLPLVLAAPELLDACKKVLEKARPFRFYPQAANIVEMLERVVAHAEGREA